MDVQIDDVHETAGHSHAPDNGAVAAAAKVSMVNMRTAEQSAPGVRPSSVMSSASCCERRRRHERPWAGRTVCSDDSSRRQKRGVQPAETTLTCQPRSKRQATPCTPEPFLIHDSDPTAHRRMLVRYDDSYNVFYQCVQCRKLGRTRTIVITDDIVVVGAKHPEDDHHPDCQPHPKTGMIGIYVPN